MATEPLTIKVDPESELARALAGSEPSSIRLDVSGVRYRVSREDDDLWANYDPERVRAGLRRFAGSISPEDAQRLKELIYRGREEGTRPLDRP